MDDINKFIINTTSYFVTSYPSLLLIHIFMKEVMKKRTKAFAIAIWRFCEGLPKTDGYKAYSNQLIWSSSSIGANYRAAQRGKSLADFINKLKIVEEEADETLFFLELIEEIDSSRSLVIKPLLQEGNEILSIIVASIKTARRKGN